MIINPWDVNNKRGRFFYMIIDRLEGAGGLPGPPAIREALGFLRGLGHDTEGRS
jgi:hypothetical protein